MARWTISRILASTLGAPLITRDTVARDTPAASATWSIVGCRPLAGRELMRSVIAPGPEARRALSRPRVPPLPKLAAPVLISGPPSGGTVRAALHDDADAVVHPA